MTPAEKETKRSPAVAVIAEQLHDLCQPLTALQCRLEIGHMQANRCASGCDATVWADCLRECRRLNLSVAKMQALVAEMQSDSKV